MIQRDLNVVTVEGNLQGTEIEMSIDKAAEHLIMERLIRLYTNPIQAFIREMSTNAFDAVVESVGGIARDAVLDGTAGRPIEVTLPARLAPMFIVRDSGVGMTYEDIVEVYSRYGASTKRESNDFNGALGFGCKSPLAYTPSFTVQSVKNGHRVTLQVGRTPKGGGKMSVVEGDKDNPCPTTEPTGTTVIIPVRSEDIARVESEARKFFLTWKPGTVLVNGEQPQHIEPILRLTPTLAVIEGREDLILMANVAYPTLGRLNTGLRDGYALLAEVPTGDVEFTPSREGLENTPHTAKRVQQAVHEFKAACKGAIQKKIDQATSKNEALEAMLHWRSALPTEARSASDEYIYRGDVLPSKWDESKQPGIDWPFLISDFRSYVESRHTASDRITARQMSRQVFVTGFTPGKFTSNHKRKLNMWRAEKDPAHSWNADEYILVRADSIPLKYRNWINPARIVGWEHVRTTYKVPTNRSLGTGTSYKTVMGSYDEVWTEGGFLTEVKASEIRQDKPIYWFDKNTRNPRDMRAIIPALHQEYTIVKLPSNRIAKFCRDFPAAKRITAEAAQAAYDAWRPTVTDDDLLGLAAFEHYRYNSSRTRLSYFDANRVDDPKLKRAIQILKKDLTELDERATVFVRVLGSKAALSLPTWSDPMDAYPLLNRATSLNLRTQLEHAYLYMNAVYAANTTTP